MAIFTPAKLWRDVERRSNGVDEEEFVNGRAFKRTREAWCAARFALGYERLFGACTVDIEEVDEQMDYDFHLCLSNGEHLPFQIIEALDEHRRRHDEYRLFTREQRLAVEAARGGSPDYGAERVRVAIQSKIDRHIANSHQLHLLIYLNVNAGSVAWATLAGPAEDEARHFASVWIVTEQMICCIYSGSRWTGLVDWKMIEP